MKYLDPRHESTWCVTSLLLFQMPRSNLYERSKYDLFRQADAFYFNVVPFSDDMREFTFNNFKSVPESLQPNEAQQEAADNFVRMLDLAPDGGEELLQPEHTVNPILQV